MNGLLTVMLIVVLAPLGVMVAAIPYLTRKTESFGVSIEERHWLDPEIRGMRRTYALGTGTAAALVLLAGLAAAAFLDERSLVWLLPALTGVMLIAQAAFYLRFHFRMKALKVRRGLLSSEQEIVADTAFHREKRAFSNRWLLPHLAVAAATAAFCLIFYDRFPEQLVMQYDLQGNPTRTVGKSYPGVLMPVILQLFLVLMFWITNYMIASSKQQLDASRPRQSLVQNLAFRRRWSAFMLIAGFLMVLSFAVMPLQMMFQFPVSAALAALLAASMFIVLGSIVLAVTTGQGGSRIRVGEPAGEPAAGRVNRDDDRHWKLGVFYFNPDDPAIFLEKRFGVGWTVNWARPAAWALLFGPLVLIVVILITLEMLDV